MALNKSSVTYVRFDRRTPFGSATMTNHAVDGITVKPTDEISITTPKPMKSPLKTNKTIGGDVQTTSSDKRFRRLIPYMSYYYPGNDYNYPGDYMPMQPTLALRKKPSPQIPNIAFLYGGSPKYAQQHQRPAVQAGFIYKARPEPYKSYVPIQPQMQPSYNNYKYQQAPNNAYQPSAQLKPVVTSDKHNFTPFLVTNKLAGDFVPIFKSNNLPYKSYDDFSVQQNAPKHHTFEKMKPMDEDEFLPMNPAHYYHHSPPNSNHLFRSKLGTKIISTAEHRPPITYSSPTPVYVTSTESPHVAIEQNEPPQESYDYEEIVVHHATSPAPPVYHTVRVTTFAPDEKYIQKVKSVQEHTYPDLHSSLDSSSISDVLTKLKKSNHLPETITTENVDGSIKTLVKILNNLKEKDVPKKPSPTYSNHANDDYDYSTDEEDDALRDGSPEPNRGRPGVDYPIYHEIPQTNFTCKDQRYKGFFGDTDTNCQVWHYCDLNGGKASFLCPNGTIFSQVALTCDWWFNVRCASTPQLYVLNERLYKFILPFQPKFPEDYSGPLVDKYLAIKFQEMEEKLRIEKEEEKKEADAKRDQGPDLDSEQDENDEDNQNDVEVDVEAVPNETVEIPTAVESESAGDDKVVYTPGPIRVPTHEQLVATNSIAVSELPPIPKTVVEQERLEMIEINNDGTSGHLTHSLD